MHVSKLKQAGKRSFTVVGAYHSNGCPTKFNSDSRLISSKIGRAHV